MGAIPGRRQTEIAVLALLERGACAFALSRTGRGELLHGVSVLHVPEAIQNARVIGAIARLKHRPVSIELVTCIAHEACRSRIPASSQRVEDALVVPLTGCLCAVVPSDSAARARQTQKGPRPIARCAALPFFGECASLRRLVRLESLLQRGIHPRLPASAGRFEGVEHVIVEPNRRRGFVTAERPPRPAADQAVADVLVRPLKNSSVSSGASSGSTQSVCIARLLTVICFPHADNAASLAAWRPNHHDHAAVQRADRDVARFNVTRSGSSKCMPRRARAGYDEESESLGVSRTAAFAANSSSLETSRRRSHALLLVFELKTGASPFTVPR